MNILWKQLDGTLALSSVFQHTLARMEEARGYADLVPFRADLTDRMEKGTQALMDLQAAMQAVQPALPEEPGEDADDDQKAAYQAEYDAAIEAAQAEVARLTKLAEELRSSLAPVADSLQKISIYDDVKASIGLTVEEHAEIAQAGNPHLAGAVLLATGLDDDAFPTEWPQETWEWVDGAIVVSLARALESTKTRLREERAPLLADLDVAYMRALERGEDTTAIIAEKTRLRDITQLADACTTLAELKALSCTP